MIVYQNATNLQYFSVAVDQFFYPFVVVAADTPLPHYFLGVASVTVANKDNSSAVIVASSAVVATLRL